jgi:ABC-type transport system substrate-binding protein
VLARIFSAIASNADSWVPPRTPPIHIDPLTWNFELRQGVRFHDGTPLTAEDVAFSIDRARDEDSELNFLLDSVARVEVVDPGTVCRAQCEKPYGDRGCAAYSS